ncbi:hypothetical protein JZ751_009468 [Albula glossodonta]|uniref:Uncharacterized protein n=1 Tax=Albula glossodonta TaxID=121402 RepID=A0A8T2P5T6_9TELE|nr:hypothetical protein JZ751_009468 [Albula glossodonta]
MFRMGETDTYCSSSLTETSVKGASPESSYLPAPPEKTQKVPVLQLLHNRDQWCMEGDHTQHLWQERMCPQLRQEGGKAQKGLPLTSAC